MLLVKLISEKCEISITEYILFIQLFQTCAVHLALVSGTWHTYNLAGYVNTAAKIIV